MSQPEKQFGARVREYWDWFSVALFLLVTVDLLTTMAATASYGPAAEANPVMRWLLLRGPVAVTVVNLGVVVLAAYAFSGVVETVRRAPEPVDTYLEYAVEVWLGALVAIGLLVVANNLSVIVQGQSLL